MGLQQLHFTLLTSRDWLHKQHLKRQGS